MPNPPLLERHFLERLERLTLHWEKSFAGLIGGHNPSRFPGGGQEFLDHRNFHHGDDLRAVNWRAYLRLEKLFLKMFQIEPRVPVRMLLDCSQSMATPTEQKFLYTRQLAASLCYIGLVRLDTIVIQPFASGLNERFLCGGGRHRFSPAVNYLSGLNASGGTDYMETVRQFVARYPQRGLLVVISDFLDDEGCEKALQYLSDFGHEMFLIQLWADEDRTPPWTGDLDLEDAETGARMRIQIDPEAQIRYTEAFDEHASRLQHLAARKGGRYVGVATSAPLADLIFGPMLRSRGIA